MTVGFVPPNKCPKCGSHVGWDGPKHSMLTDYLLYWCRHCRFMVQVIPQDATPERIAQEALTVAMLSRARL